MNRFLVTALVLGTVTAVSGRAAKNELGCLDENGNPVEWFYIKKLPRIASAGDDNIKQGEGYLVMSSGDDVVDWKLSKKSINSKQSAVGQTLTPLYKTKGHVHVMYSDHPPNGGESGTLGHTKGVVAFRESSGFWLVHSVPRFPPPAEEKGASYEYPETGTRYGQTMMCLTLNAKTADRVGTLLRYSDPNVFSSSVGKGSWVSKINNLVEMTSSLKGIRPKNMIYTMQNLTTDDDLILAFGKSRHFNADIYSGLLTSNLTVDLFANTWQNARDPMPSDCEGKYSVLNVDVLRVPGTSITFTSSNDHSKWAVSADKKKPWACVTGINRTKFQEKRGGEALCLKDERVWKAFSSLVSETEECKN